ncbi:hypothetical protein NDU88_004685 [Pleurodeles waltl]|uniref:Uncharacterized protein n=1 Tax=Pleurodeles waltl TaxID=8319 RepID=A0AAV7UHS3_PLEWA|nr:hypothetical protein NDU88_004685 [Pleurodeles waltl]
MLRLARNCILPLEFVSWKLQNEATSPVPQGGEQRKDNDTRVDVTKRREDVARETRRHADSSPEREKDATTEEEEQDRKKQAGEEIQWKDGRELKTSLVKESYPETKGGGEEKQADADSSGRHGGVCCVPGGMWLTQVSDRLRGHLGPVLRRVRKKREMKGQKTRG